MNVYIGKGTDGLLLPENGERNANKGNVLASGSSYDGRTECNIVRQFIWWTNASDGRSVDIDTAVSFLDTGLEPIAECSYFSHKAEDNDVLIAIHSGDIVDGGDVDGTGVAEFIDIDKTAAKSIGARYAVLTVSSFNAQPYCNLPNVKFGLMEREGALDERLAGRCSGESAYNGAVFEPSTVDFCVDLNADAKQVVPVIYDIENDRFFWIDKPIKLDGPSIINTENPQTKESIRGMIQKYATNTNPTPSVADLFIAYASAKGKLVMSAKEADIIVTADSVTTADIPLKDGAVVLSAFDMDRISAEYMGIADMPDTRIDAGIREFEAGETDGHDICDEFSFES